MGESEVVVGAGWGRICHEGRADLFMWEKEE